MKAVSYHGTNINNGTAYDTVIESDVYSHNVDYSALPRFRRYPILGNWSFPPKEFTLRIFVRAGGNSATIRELFRPSETSKTLIVEDPAGTTDRFIRTICRSLTEVPGSGGKQYLAVLVATGDGLFRGVTKKITTRNVTSTPGTEEFSQDNEGETVARPVVKITPGTAKTSGNWDYRRYMRVSWTSPFGAKQFPIDLGKAAFDTATLVTAGKMRSDGFDIKVVVDGVSVDRWIVSPNTANTKVWVNLDFEPEIELTLKTDLDAITDPIDVEVNESIVEMPDAGVFSISAEVFVYTEKNDATRTFKNCSRAARNTSIAAHTAGASIFWLQHDIYILYGNSAVTTDPTPGDENKPTINLSTSTNNSFVFSLFGSDSGLRTPEWKHKTRTGEISATGTGDHIGVADPWDHFGVEILDDPEAVTDWSELLYIFIPTGINDVDIDFDVYSDDKNQYTARLLQSIDGIIWETFIGDPTVSVIVNSTWESKNLTDALDKAYDQYFCAIEIAIIRILSALTHRAEITAATVATEATTHITINMNAEATNYTLDAILTNITTGDALRILIETFSVNDTVVIDTEEKTVEFDATGESLFSSLEIVGGVRSEWLEMVTGTNEFTYIETGVVDVDVIIETEERYHE